MENLLANVKGKYRHLMFGYNPERKCDDWPIKSFRRQSIADIVSTHLDMF